MSPSRGMSGARILKPCLSFACGVVDWLYALCMLVRGLFYGQVDERAVCSVQCNLASTAHYELSNFLGHPGGLSSTVHVHHNLVELVKVIRS